MTITVEVTGDTERLLVETAERAHVSVEELAVTAIQRFVSSSNPGLDEIVQAAIAKNRELLERLS